MVALEARIQRLKGLSPIKIKECALEKNLNVVEKEEDDQLGCNKAMRDDAKVVEFEVDEEESEVIEVEGTEDEKGTTVTEDEEEESSRVEVEVGARGIAPLVIDKIHLSKICENIVTKAKTGVKDAGESVEGTESEEDNDDSGRGETESGNVEEEDEYGSSAHKEDSINGNSENPPSQPLTQVSVDIVKANALPTLVLMLRSEDAAIHYEAVGVTENLVHSSPNIKKEVLLAGALQPVIGLLSSYCLESQREAALLLGQFAATDSDCKVHIVQRGAVPPLIEMLQCPDSQLREMSAFALGRLAQEVKLFTKLSTDPTSASELVAKEPTIFTVAFNGASWTDPNSIALMVIQSMLGSWNKNAGGGKNMG
ncbi:hypothetical protein U1Q18_029218 [Sarracenia purpurea var. burkii]